MSLLPCSSGYTNSLTNGQDTRETSTNDNDVQVFKSHLDELAEYRKGTKRKTRTKCVSISARLTELKEFPETTKFGQGCIR